MNELGPVLVVKGLTKRFPGVLAVDDVSLEVRTHEIVGLVGENGAGKSTVLKILAGLYRADSGVVTWRGQPVSFHNVAQAFDAGIGMVFQEQSLLPNISVAENILLGHESDAVRMGWYNWKELRRSAKVQLDKLDSDISPSALTETLSFAQRQVVELARVLSIEERTHHEPLILLDEPTSVLDGDEAQKVLDQICRLRNLASVVFVSHRLDEVLKVSDRVYVMTDGRCVAERDPKGCSVIELQELMLGRQLSEEYYRNGDAEAAASETVRLSVQELCLKGSYEAVSFDLHVGEVLGLAGVQGSGRETLCRTLFGAEGPDSGRLLIDGEEMRFGSPADAVRAGVSYVPAERRTEGIVAGLSVRRNITLSHTEEVQKGPFLDSRRELDLVKRWIERLHIKTPSPETPAGNLSGGNQQKVVLAKWLISRQPKVLVLDHPMRGLDVGAKAEVFALIRGLAASGIAIILIGDTLDEIIALSHNIIVMRDGQISGRFPALSGNKPSPLAIIERMV